MKNIIVVTGGAGFVGSNLISLLLKKTKHPFFAPTIESIDSFIIKISQLFLRAFIFHCAQIQLV